MSGSKSAKQAYTFRLGKTHWETVEAADESAARKAFQAACKKAGRDLSLEIVRVA